MVDQFVGGLCAGVAGVEVGADGGGDVVGLAGDLFVGEAEEVDVVEGERVGAGVVGGSLVGGGVGDVAVEFDAEVVASVEAVEVGDVAVGSADGDLAFGEFDAVGLEEVEEAAFEDAVGDGGEFGAPVEDAGHRGDTVSAALTHPVMH